MSPSECRHLGQGRTFGQYRLNRLLGKGGMGQVYEAYDTVKDRTVALKILAEQYSQDAEFRTRFQRESHAAAILQEPHVIPIHDWGEIDGNLYIDMRLVKGQTLHELIRRGPVEPVRAVAVIEQVAAALDAAHAEGLIHRDVKPQNIDPETYPGRPEAQSGPVAADPAAAHHGDARSRPGSWALPIAVAVASALLLGAIGVIIGLLAGRNSSSGKDSGRTMAYPPPATYTVTAPSTPATQAWVPPVRPSRMASPTASSPTDPEAELRQLARSDLPYVRARLADQWIPQLSSKRPGVVDDGMVWDDALTLQEHLRLRQRYPSARLLWSGDWSTFSAPNFWVTVAGITFSDSSGALAWCRNQGFDSDPCIAKVVSTTLPISGSTAYN